MTAELQPLLTLAGLTLDFLGFCLLLREWWIAFFSDQAMMAQEEALERQQKMRAFASQTASDAMKRHMSVAGQMQDDMMLRQMRDGRRAAFAGRKRWFVTATIFVVLGFGLQVAGAIPL